MAFVPGTRSDDIIIPIVGGYTYLGGAGSDTYVIARLVGLPSSVVAITDTEDSNKIQLADGLSIASSLFAANAVQLTLSNGVSVQVLGAGSFAFEIGANVTADDPAAMPNQSYAQFAAAFGVATLPTGNAVVSGTPNFIVPRGTGSPFSLTGAAPAADSAMAPEVSLAGLVDPFSLSLVSGVIDLP